MGLFDNDNPKSSKPSMRGILAGTTRGHSWERRGLMNVCKRCGVTVDPSKTRPPWDPLPPCKKSSDSSWIK